MRLIAASIGLLALTGLSGIAHAQTAPTAATSCADVSAEEFAKLPQLERDRTLNCFIAAAAAEISKTLPQKVDEMTTLERIDAQGTILTYRYTVAVLRKDVPAGAFDALKTVVAGKVCESDDMKFMVGAGGSYHYIWNDKIGEMLAELTVASC